MPNYDYENDEPGPGVYSRARIFWDPKRNDWYVVVQHYREGRMTFDLMADPGETLASVKKRAAQFSGQKPSEVRVLKHPPRDKYPDLPENREWHRKHKRKAKK